VLCDVDADAVCEKIEDNDGDDDDDDDCIGKSASVGVGDEDAVGDSVGDAVGVGVGEEDRHSGPLPTPAMPPPGVKPS